MRRIRINRNFIFIFRLIIGFVFIYASVYKIANPEEFAKNIANYRILPLFLINFVAIFLPWLELIMGLFIIFGIFIKSTSYLLVICMSVFTFLVLITILRGIDINCGCFSSDINSTPIGWKKFFENILLLLISIILYYSDENFLSVERYFKTNKII
jgi:putative oxidoreductase